LSYSIPAGKALVIGVSPVDSGYTIASLTATIDNTTPAYIVSTGGGKFAIVSRSPASDVTVNISMSGTDQFGQSFSPSLSIAADILAPVTPPDPPPPTSLSVTYTNLIDASDAGADPGTPTIVLLP
jgi:hypothetical protein